MPSEPAWIRSTGWNPRRASPTLVGRLRAAEPIDETCRPPPPVKILVNGKTHELSSESSLADLLRSLQVEPKGVAIEVNAELVPRTKHRAHRLSDGDRVEIVTFVGGG